MFGAQALSNAEANAKTAIAVVDFLIVLIFGTVKTLKVATTETAKVTSVAVSTALTVIISLKCANISRALNKP